MTKIGRNDPCHCGSGKKYKKCCSAKDDEARSQELAAARAAVATEEPAAKEAQTGKSPGAVTKSGGTAPRPKGVPPKAGRPARRRV